MIPRLLNGLRACRLFLILVVLAASPAARGETVTAMFSKAQKALKEGKTKTAYKGLLGIIRRYPDHEPSHLLLGHILARSGETGKAYKHFKRVSPELVTPDLGYEYGLIMFQAKNCNKALTGFGKVPSGSKFADLASFYRGICYYRSRQFQKAQYYLAKAKDLPASLQATRRQALSEARQQAKRERQGGPYQANPYLIVPTPPPMPLAYDPYAAQPPAPAAGQEVVPAPPKKPEKPPPPPSGGTAAITPSATFTQKSTNQDFFGFKQAQTDSSKQEIKASFALKYTAEPRASGGQPYVSLPIDLLRSSESTKGETIAYKAYSDDPGTIIEEQTAVPGATTTTTGIKLQPTGDYPVGAKSDVSLAYLYDTKTVKVSTATSETTTSEIGPVGNAAIGTDSFNLKLTLASTVVEDNRKVDDGELKGVDQSIKTDRLKLVADLDKNWDTVSGGLTVTNQSHKTAVSGSQAGLTVTQIPPSFMSIAADLTKNWESVSFTGTVTQTTKEDQKYQGFVPTGETSGLKIDLSATKTFSFGGTAVFTVTQNQLSEYRKTVALPKPADAAEEDPAPSVQVKANATEQTVFTSFKLTPIDWAFGLASYKTTTRSFENVPPEALQTFQGAEPETVTELVFQVGVTKTF